MRELCVVVVCWPTPSGYSYGPSLKGGCRSDLKGRAFPQGCRTRDGRDIAPLGKSPPPGPAAVAANRRPLTGIGQYMATVLADLHSSVEENPRHASDGCDPNAVIDVELRINGKQSEETTGVRCAVAPIARSWAARTSKCARLLKLLQTRAHCRLHGDLT